jgi:CRP-like cAMP-binding protein
VSSAESDPKASFLNEILAALPPDEIGRLRPLLTRVRLANGQGLHEPGKPIGVVFFIESGFASMMAGTDDAASSIEVGLIGREGMTGLATLSGPDVVPFNRVMVQMPGAAYCMPAPALRDHAEAMPMLDLLLTRALAALMAQVSQTAACNSRHTLRQRLARWLLLAHDRADGDELPLTQEFLSVMLAVRRPGVSVTMAGLQAAGLVRHTRGRVLIGDRSALEGAACGCYSRVKAYTATLALGRP